MSCRYIESAAATSDKFSEQTSIEMLAVAFQALARLTGLEVKV